MSGCRSDTLARFVVEVIDGLDMSELVKEYRGSGSASYHPAMLLGLLVYGYATKVFSSRAIERATHDSVAFRFIAGNENPGAHCATLRRQPTRTNRTACPQTSTQALSLAEKTTGRSS